MAPSLPERELLSRIDRSELTELVQALVRHPSPNPPGSEESVARFLAETCDRLRLRTDLEEVAPGRPNVYASLGPADEPGLLFLVHTDTVPAGEGWSRPPFGGDLADGWVIGRGAADMKAGIAAAVIAMAALQRSGHELSRPVALAAVIDEEETGAGVRALLERPGFGALAAIVPEPTELQTVIACRGNCYVEVEISGRSAHAGSPQEGRNAIYGAARVVDAIRRLHDGLASRRHPLLGRGELERRDDRGRDGHRHGARPLPASPSIAACCPGRAARTRRRSSTLRSRPSTSARTVSACGPSC